jgi:PIN domain nuclease of toxin-antitoxin system
VNALLDTHVLVWWFEREGRLSDAQRRVLKRASAAEPVMVSDISLWEIATLASLGRLKLKLPLRDWLDRAAAPPLVQRCGISPAIAALTTTLPPEFQKDPADRIIVATAQALGATLLTCDESIIDADLVPTL